MSTALTFLRPLRQLRSNAFSSHFSTSSIASAGRRTNKDRSKLRGVSALRRQPKKIALAAAKFELPEPVDLSEHTDKVEVDPDHGLWGFFLDKKALPTPIEDSEHGRSWSAEELRAKSWDDLHKLWWVCIKELNILATQKLERDRLKPGEGDHESQARRIQVKNTLRGIKHVLTERYYAWDAARVIGATDPEVNLSGEGQAYVPTPFEEPLAEGEEAVDSAPVKPATL